MGIVKWTLFNELDPVQRHINRLFEVAGFLPATPVPAADVYETPEEYVVAVDVPGYEESELVVELTDHTLAVRGERKQMTDEEARAFALRERLERKFERRFMLPSTADTTHVKAVFRKGVLEVHAPKSDVNETTKVAITTG
jgi:HSP20 family protein